MSMLMLYIAIIGLFNRIQTKQISFNKMNYFHMLFSKLLKFLMYYFAIFFISYLTVIHRSKMLISWWVYSTLTSKTLSYQHTYPIHRFYMYMIIDTLYFSISTNVWRHSL